MDVNQEGMTSSEDVEQLEEISQAVVPRQPPDLLLVVFIHGFKGTDSTFGPFPDRLRHVLTETVPDVIVESIVFPAYETKGELNEAVEKFADWLVTLTVEREVANGSGGGAGKAKIVLCGHSMGGLLAADTLIQMVNSRPDADAPLWPKIIALLAFDTPYYGLHPFVFRNSATKAAQYAKTARDLWNMAGSIQNSKPAPAIQPKGMLMPAPAAEASGWSKWAMPAAYAVGGTLLAGAAVGTAYMRKDDIGAGYAWATDHMKYVGNLWKEDQMKERVERILQIEEELGVSFRAWYTLLPPEEGQKTPRTFVVIPKSPPTVTGSAADIAQSSPDTSGAYSHFLPAKNSIASNEIQAHTGMFTAATNDGYYDLGLQTARIIREAIMRGRGTVEDQSTEAQEVRDNIAGEKLKEAMADGAEAHQASDTEEHDKDANTTEPGIEHSNHSEAHHTDQTVNAVPPTLSDIPGGPEVWADTHEAKKDDLIQF